MEFFGKIRQQLSKTWVLEGLIQSTQQTQVPIFHKIQLENFKINEMDLQKYQRSYLKAIGQYENPLFKKSDFLCPNKPASSKENFKKWVYDTSR